MITGLANVTLMVEDYDGAIQWFTEKLGLELRMDGSMGGDRRFVTVGVPGQDDISIVLHRITPESPQTGNYSPGLLFHCTDCRKMVDDLKTMKVQITLEPEEQPWGVQAVFVDLYGNSHVLLEPSPMA